MAANPTPDDDDILIALTEDLADGCHLHEVTLGIKQQTEAVMRAALLGIQTALMGLGAALFEEVVFAAQYHLVMGWVMTSQWSLSWKRSRPSASKN